jgi:TolB-like protein/Tfp pilus assembly protein PilF
MNDFLQHLRERKMVQWALAYVAAAFALIQVFDIVAQRFGWPESIERGLIVVLAIGFFVTLVLAWYHGERGAQRATGTELLILALLLTIGGGLLWRLSAAPSANVAAEAAKSSSAQANAHEAAAPDKSIAVLPFENLSSDKDNAYFATGMQDEILTRLAGIHDLKVISRTSTEQYASHPPNLKIVAEQLGVATLLEGSVQRADGKVRINLQLIDARSDSHLWAQNYDRDLKDVFAVQSDVAEKVADALQAQLLPAESARIASVPTQNQEAYDLYLRANAHYQRAYDQVALVPTEMPLAIALYQQALAKDPGFALAAAMLSLTHMRTYWQLPDRTEARLAAAKAAAEQALALQPDLGEAHVALGVYWYYGHLDYTQALQQLDLARKTLPNSASVETYAALIARRQGRWNDAIAGLQRAIVLDPRSSLSIDQVAYAYQSLRRYTEADPVFARAVAVAHDPTDEQIAQGINTVLWKGDLAPLRAALGSLTAGNDDYSGNSSSLFLLGWWSRDYAAATKTAQSDTAANWSVYSNEVFPRQLYLAWAYQAGGDNAKAQPLYTELRAQMQAALLQRPDDADLHLALGFAAAGLGLKDEAIREGRKAVSLMPMNRDAFSAPSYVAYLAQLYVRVGENGEAIETLQQVLAMPSSGGAISPALLKLDPVWDPLRKDPRFQKLIVDGEAAQAQTKP